MSESYLEAMQRRGWVKAEDGSWHNPVAETAIRRRNLAGLGQPERKPNPPQTLDRGHALRQSCPCRVAIRVEIVSFRKRLLDDDNNVAGNKPLRDSIAHSLGIDDGDPCFSWEYSQCLTKGGTGTLVKIALTACA